MTKFEIIGKHINYPNMKRLIPFLIIIFSLSNAYGQSARQYAKAGKEFVEAKNYKDALVQYTKAINLDPKKTDFYLQRAMIFEKLGNIDSAFVDITRALVFDDEIDTRVEAARLSLLLKNYDEALKQCDAALTKKRSCNEAFEIKTKTLIEQQEYYKAKMVSDEALQNKETAVNFYLNAVILENLGNLESSEKSYRKAISKDKKLEEAYVGLSNLLVKLNKFNEAMEQCQTLLKMNPDNVDAYIARSKVYVKLQDFPNAIVPRFQSLGSVVDGCWFGEVA